MRRHCDGRDPNLSMYVDPETGERLARDRPGAELKPCDCGRVFDDERRLTFWPHEAL